MAIKKAEKSAGEKAFMPMKAQKAQQQQQPSGEAEPRNACAPRRSCLHKQLRKTKFCMYHLQGVCEFGDSCAFAHSCVELQGAPDLRKTRLCKAFVNGNCKEVNCLFAHSEEELRSTDLFYKKSLCMWYEKGRCRNGDQCRFAHGIDELQSWPLPAGDAPGNIVNAGGAVPGSSGRRSGKSGGQGRQQGGGKGGAGGGRHASGSSEAAGADAAASTAVSAGATAAAFAAAMAGPASSCGEAAVAPPLPFGAGAGSATGSAGLAGVGPAAGIGLLPGGATGGSFTSGYGGPLQPPPGIDPRLPGARSSLEPMFVKTAPQLSALQEGLDHLTNQQRQMEQLQRTLAATVDTELVRRCERQIESLQTVSADVAAVAANGRMVDGTRGMALQAELDKLTQNIAALSVRLSRFENQVPMRPPALQGPGSVSQALLQQASALAQHAMLVGASGQDTRSDATGGAVNIPPYGLGSVASPSMSQLYGLNPSLFHA